jgi:uncharacterized phage-associated protein
MNTPKEQDWEPFPPLVGFDSAKAAQAAAYFALQSEGKIEKLKLIKLLYLAEREAMLRHDHPMFYDEFYSLKDGPICSNALNGINGGIDRETWAKYVRRNGNIITPVKRFERSDLDELSNAEIDILEALWDNFSGYTASQIRRYTHEQCPEYNEVTTGRLPITYLSVFEALGKPDPKGLAESVEEVRRAEVVLGA